MLLVGFKSRVTFQGNATQTARQNNRDTKARLVMNLVLQNQPWLFRDAMDEFQRHPLASAEKVDLLLRLGASPNVRDLCEETFLHKAMRGNHPRSFKRLLAHPAIKVDQRNGEGCTAFMLAVLYKLDTVVNTLLEKGANLAIQDRRGLTASDYAALTGNHALLTRLLATPQGQALTQTRQLQLAHQARAQQDKVRQYTETPLPALNRLLHQAVLEASDDADSIPRICALWAAGAEIDAPDRNGFTPLITAVRAARQNNVSLLLTLGANPDIPDAQGHTPLMVAAMLGHMKALQSLLAAGANVNAAAMEGSTALMKAAMQPNPDILARLLAYGANVNQTDFLNRIALMHAVAYNHMEHAQLLLQAGSFVNHISHDGSTAAIKAAGHGHGPMLRLLLQAGVDIRAQGRDIIRMAQRFHHPHIEELILNHPAYS